MVPGQHSASSTAKAKNLFPDYLIRPLLPSDRARVRELIIERLGSEIVVAHRVVYRPRQGIDQKIPEGSTSAGKSKEKERLLRTRC